jgi:hypothetical protein
MYNGNFFITNVFSRHELGPIIRINPHEANIQDPEVVASLRFVAKVSGGTPP